MLRTYLLSTGLVSSKLSNSEPLAADSLEEETCKSLYNTPCVLLACGQVDRNKLHESILAKQWYRSNGTLLGVKRL
jgi:hypothetical protein